MSQDKHTERVNHDRKATTATDTWDEEPMDRDTALDLLEGLERQGFEVRLAVEALHPDSVIIKTIDNQDDADATLANIALEEDYPRADTGGKPGENQ